MDGLDTQHIVTNISNMASNHESKKKEIGRDAIVAVNICNALKRRAAIKILWTACKPNTYLTLWATCHKTIKQNKNNIGCIKIVAVDSMKSMRTIAAIRIPRTNRKTHTYLYS
jgi:hypothetical protein